MLVNRIMRIVFYSNVLNHHQASVADELYRMLGDEYAFVELSSCRDMKGAGYDYSQRPYIIKAWQSAQDYAIAMDMARGAEVCVFAGHEALPFEKERLKAGLLSFDMGERLLKKGVLNLASPRIFKMVAAYHLQGWRKKPLYKLACSAFTAGDCRRLGMYDDRCYKWGYFTSVDENFDFDNEVLTEKTNKPVKIMWCGRLITLKHPELVVEMAKELKAQGYNFIVNIFGGEGSVAKYETKFPVGRLKSMIDHYGLEKEVIINGFKSNEEIRTEMKEHDIFLFTSDRNEGWGAVANESLANGCVLVASDAIGSSPYLINDGYNGYMFKSCNTDSLTEKVKWLLDNRLEMRQMQRNAYQSMKDTWSPKHAAESLLRLISCLKGGCDSDISCGPCSKA